jgi:hypothetical protein
MLPMIIFDPHKEVVDSLADGLEHLSSGVQTFLPSLTPVNQELHVMPQILPPSLPPMFEGKLPLDKWVCDKCDAEQSVNKMRCGACKSWRGGEVRGVHLRNLNQLKTTSNIQLIVVGNQNKHNQQQQFL